MDVSGGQSSFRHSGEGSRKIPEPGAVGLSLAFQRTTADGMFCLSVLNVLMLLSLCNAVMMGVDLVPTLKWKLGAKQLSSVGVKDMYSLPLALCLYCTVMVTHPSLR